jgi:hypothetical protein
MIKKLTEYFSRKENFDYVNAATSEVEKRSRIAELKMRFDAGNFSTFAFAAVEDVGRDDFSFMNDERDSYPAYDGLQAVRRVVEDAKAKSDALAYAEARNKVIRAGRQRAKRNLSKPFTYDQHETK